MTTTHALRPARALGHPAWGAFMCVAPLPWDKPTCAWVGQRPEDGFNLLPPTLFISREGMPNGRGGGVAKPPVQALLWREEV